LSAALSCIAVSVAIHDDDIFFFEVHDDGLSVISGSAGSRVLLRHRSRDAG
jgi:hypothetical protein